MPVLIPTLAFMTTTWTLWVCFLTWKWSHHQLFLVIFWGIWVIVITSAVKHPAFALTFSLTLTHLLTHESALSWDTTKSLMHLNGIIMRSFFFVSWHRKDRDLFYCLMAVWYGTLTLVSYILRMSFHLNHQIYRVNPCGVWSYLA